MVLYGTVPPSQDPKVPIDLVSCPASIPMKERYHSTQTLADVHCIWVVFFPFPCLHALVKDVWSSNLSRDINSMSRKKVQNGTFSWTSGATGLSSVGAGESHPESALV